jgi:glycosyltransferase involved in cell wall biosynthesis
VDKRVVLQHVFGAPNSGGPVVALERLIAANSEQEFIFHRMAQPGPAGGINFGILSSFMNEISRVKPAMVHVRGLGNEGFHGALAARLAGVRRILVSVHGTVRDHQLPGRRLKDALISNVLEPATLSMASHIMTVCHYAAERDFLAPYRRKFVGVVHNGVEIPCRDGEKDMLLRENFGVSPEDVVAICVSRITWEKGYSLLAESLFRLPPLDRLLHIWIVGDGPNRSEIESAMPRRNDVVVRFLGHRSDVKKILGGGDIFLFPSLHENLSNALLEGMSQGLPAVAFSVGGNAEVIGRDTGVLIPPGDSLSFAHALARYVLDSKVRRFHGECARDEIARNFSISNMAEGMFSVYRRVLSEDVK